MPAPAVVDGTGLVLTFAGVDYACSITEWEVRSEDAADDTVTFCEIADGSGYDYFLTVSSLSATVSGSLWRFLWQNPGLKSVAYVLKPHGNAAASTAQPHLSGTLTVPGGMPALGHEANKVATRNTFETEFKLDGKPTLVIV